MAEAFARHYGSDVIVPASAGTHPAMGIARDTKKVMKEKDIDLSAHFPKSVSHMARIPFDLVINMSGSRMPESLSARATVVDWAVDDPIGLKYEGHCEVRDELEKLVMKLILDLRSEIAAPKFRGQGSGKLEL